MNSLEIKEQYRKSIIDYPTAARSIALNLEQFCEEDLPYPAMITYAALQASDEIKSLKAQIKYLQSIKQ